MAPVRPADPRFRPDPAATAKAADADRVVSGAGAQLNYLSSVSVSLGLPDPVQEYFGPIVGRWRDLHDQAEAWRRAAHSVEELADGVTSPLARLDAVWQGAVSESFLAHMRQAGKAATSSSDAMAAMADVLDKTGQAMHQLVTDLVDLLAGGADRVSLALLLPSGEERAGNHIAELHAHGRRMLESVHELLEAFARMCRSLDERQPFAEVRQATPFPEQAWSFATTMSATTMPAPDPVPTPDPAPTPDSPAGAAAHAAAAGGAGGAHVPAHGAGAAVHASAPPEPGMRTFAAQPGTVGPSAGTAAAATPVAAAAAGQRAAGGAGGVPMMPMGAGMGGQGGDSERRTRSGITADPADIFGRPSKTAPPVIGED
jgi:uncharacterized protein YukE